MLQCVVLSAAEQQHLPATSSLVVELTSASLSLVPPRLLTTYADHVLLLLLLPAALAHLAALQLIRVCSEHGQAITALSVYEWMKAPASVGGAGLGPTVYTYTAAMRAALAAGLLDRALQVWEDAQASKCAVDCRLCITYVEVGLGLVGCRWAAVECCC